MSQLRDLYENTDLEDIDRRELESIMEQAEFESEQTEDNEETSE